MTVFGFTVLGWLAIRAHTDAPPVPLQVVDPPGNVVFTGADMMQGQAIFLRNGLMECGSIFGHGAYLGPVFTAEIVRRAAHSVQASYGGAASAAKPPSSGRSPRPCSTGRTMAVRWDRQVPRAPPAQWPPRVPRDPWSRALRLAPRLRLLRPVSAVRGVAACTRYCTPQATSSVAAPMRRE